MSSNHKHIRQALARAVPSLREIALLAEDAGLELGRLRLEGEPPELAWHAVLDEAEKSARLPDLAQEIAEWCPACSELLNLLHPWLPVVASEPYIEPPWFDNLVVKLERDWLVVLVGEPGSGKSAAAKHLLDRATRPPRPRHRVHVRYGEPPGVGVARIRERHDAVAWVEDPWGGYARALYAADWERVVVDFAKVPRENREAALIVTSRRDLFEGLSRAAQERLRPYVLPVEGASYSREVRMQILDGWLAHTMAGASQDPLSQRERQSVAVELNLPLELRRLAELRSAAPAGDHDRVEVLIERARRDATADELERIVGQWDDAYRRGLALLAILIEAGPAMTEPEITEWAEALCDGAPSVDIRAVPVLQTMRAHRWVTIDGGRLAAHPSVLEAVGGLGAIDRELWRAVLGASLRYAVRASRVDRLRNLLRYGGGHPDRVPAAARRTVESWLQERLLNEDGEAFSGALDLAGEWFHTSADGKSCLPTPDSPVLLLARALVDFPRGEWQQLDEWEAPRWKESQRNLVAASLEARDVAQRLVRVLVGRRGGSFVARYGAQLGAWFDVLGWDFSAEFAPRLAEVEALCDEGAALATRATLSASSSPDAQRAVAEQLHEAWERAEKAWEDGRGGVDDVVEDGGPDEYIEHLHDSAAEAFRTIENACAVWASRWRDLGGDPGLAAFFRFEEFVDGWAAFAESAIDAPSPEEIEQVWHAAPKDSRWRIFKVLAREDAPDPVARALEYLRVGDVHLKESVRALDRRGARGALKEMFAQPERLPLVRRHAIATALEDGLSDMLEVVGAPSHGELVGLLLPSEAERSTSTELHNLTGLAESHLDDAKIVRFDRSALTEEARDFLTSVAAEAQPVARAAALLMLTHLGDDVREGFGPLHASTDAVVRLLALHAEYHSDPAGSVRRLREALADRRWSVRLLAMRLLYRRIQAWDRRSELWPLLRGLQADRNPAIRSELARLLGADDYEAGGDVLLRLLRDRHDVRARMGEPSRFPVASAAVKALATARDEPEVLEGLLSVLADDVPALDDLDFTWDLVTLLAPLDDPRVTAALQNGASSPRMDDCDVRILARVSAMGLLRHIERVPRAAPRLTIGTLQTCAGTDDLVVASECAIILGLVGAPLRPSPEGAPPRPWIEVLHAAASIDAGRPLPEPPANAPSPALQLSWETLRRVDSARRRDSWETIVRDHPSLAALPGLLDASDLAQRRFIPFLERCFEGFPGRVSGRRRSGARAR